MAPLRNLAARVRLASIVLAGTFATTGLWTGSATGSEEPAEPYANRVLAREGLVAYWRLGDAAEAGTSAVDSAHDRDGTYAGNVTRGAGGALNGDPDTAASFAGGRVDLPGMPASIDFAVEGWMRLRAGSAKTNGLYGSPGAVRVVGRPNGFFAGVRVDGVEYQLAVATPTNTSGWVHWALVRDGAVLTLYRNGMRVAERTDLPESVTARLDGTIGRIGSSYPTKGELDDLAIYSRALSAAEVNGDYRSASVSPPPPPPPEEPPEEPPEPPVSGVDFERRPIYHSPQTPGYTAWVGAWTAPDGSLLTSFPQMTGPVLAAPDRDWWRLDGNSIVLRSGDGGATWEGHRSDPFEGPPHAYSGQAVTGLRDGSLLRRVNGEDLRRPPPPPDPEPGDDPYSLRVLGRQGLISYWRLGEAGAGTAVDAAQDRDGAYLGAITQGAEGALRGDTDTAASFSGGRIDVPSMPTSTDFTVEGWMRMAPEASSNNTLYGSFGAMRLMPRPNGYYAGVWLNGTEYKLTGASQPNVGSWVHWALVRQGAALSLYRNGARIAEAGNLPADAPARLDGDIGRTETTNAALGEIDEVAVYGSALSASEVNGHYLAGVDPAPPADPPPPGESGPAEDDADYPETAFLQRLEPGGQEWSPPQVLLDPSRYTYNLTRIQYLRDGRLIATGNYWDVPAGQRVGKSTSVPPELQGWLLMVSEDEGRTWREALTVPPEHRMHPNEWDVAELPSGDLLAMMRTRDPADRTQQVRRQALLTQQGSGWVMGMPAPTPFPHSGHPELLATSEGLILNFATTGTHYTADGGKTWGPVALSADGEFSSNYYPMSLQAGDGTVYVFSHVGGDDNYGGQDQAVVMARFKLAVAEDLVLLP